MQRPKPLCRHLKVSFAVTAILLIANSYPKISAAQNVAAADSQTAPITSDQLVVLLQSGYSSDEVLEQLRKRGFTGNVDADLTTRLRKAGASTDFVLALMRLGSATPSSPAIPQTPNQQSSPTPTPTLELTSSSGIEEQAMAYYKKATKTPVPPSDQALKDLNEAIRIKPNFAEAYYTRASVYAYLDETDKAIDDYTRYIQLKPNDWEGYDARASLYKDQVQHENADFETNYRKALADFTHAIKTNPDDKKVLSSLYEFRADVHVQFKQWKEAVADATESIRLNANSLAYFDRFRANKALGNIKKSDQDYDTMGELQKKEKEEQDKEVMEGMDKMDELSKKNSPSSSPIGK